MKRLQCNLEQLGQMYAKYDSKTSPIRFGQMVWNRWGSYGPWKELFYEQDHKKAFLLAFEEVNSKV